jgi:hypothetical protein
MSDETTIQPTPRPRKAGQPGPGQKRINYFISEQAFDMMQELGQYWNPTLAKGYGPAVDRAIREAYARHIGGKKSTHS